MIVNYGLGAFKGPFSRLHVGFKTRVDRSTNRRNGTKTHQLVAAVLEDPVVFLRWWYRYQRRPVPELIERHSAGHQRHQHGGGAQAAGVVEGVLLVQLPEPFIVVVLLSLFWMLVLLPLYMSSVVVV